MGTIKSLWMGLWKIAIAAGFAGLGVLGLGLMVASVWYRTGVFWGVVVFTVGLLGVLLALGTAMTLRDSPRTGPA